MIHWGKSGPKTGAPTAIQTISLVQSHDASLTGALRTEFNHKCNDQLNLSIKTPKTLLKMFQNLI